MKKRILSLIIVLSSFFMTAQAQDIFYKVTVQNPHTHYADVEIRITNAKNSKTHFKMPVWTPGSYMVREFSRNVERFGAYDNEGYELKWQKDRKNAWLVENGDKSDFIIRYSVYANEVTVRTSFVNSETAFLLGTSMFLSAEGFENSQGEIEVIAPKEWKKIGTGLKEVDGKKNTFSFSDYDELVDSPIQIGNFDILKFKVNDIQHYVAMVGDYKADKKKVEKDIQKICQVAFDVIGKVDMNKYWFFVQHVEGAGGGLEHRNSVSVGMPPQNYSDPAKYKGFLGLIAHEYFHVWNVKRVRPIELGPFDYDNETYTRQLWVAEGFTSYYDKILPYRAGFLTQDEFFGRIAGMISYSENTPGAKYQSLAESSFDAWIKAYRPDENSVNTSISYYTKGSLAGAILDLSIIKYSNGEKNLDDLFKNLYDEFYLTKQRGFTEEEFKLSAEKIAGTKLDSYFEELVYGTVTPDYSNLFESFGITFSAIQREEPYLGLRTNTSGNNIVISNVLRNSNAYNDGLNAGDIIISVNGKEPTSNFNEFLSSFKDAKNLKIKVNRNGKELTFVTKFGENPNMIYSLSENSSKTAEQEKLFNKWIKR